MERAALKPLPSRPYELAFWKKARVNIDYHVELEGHWYSVPYGLVGKEVELRHTEACVEVFLAGRRVASHVRSQQRGRFTTQVEHMPASHRQHAEWTPSRVVQWARSVGPACAQLVEELMKRRPHPQQGFRSALGIIRLADKEKYGPKEKTDAGGPDAGEAQCDEAARKSFLACALGQKACRDGYSVVYRRASRLFDELAQARADGTHPHVLKRLAKAQVLILDDFGLEPLGAAERKELLEVLEDRYQVSSTVVTSRLEPKDWHAVIGDATLADAILDRLVHNAHRLKLAGDSIRKVDVNLTKGRKQAK